MYVIMIDGTDDTNGQTTLLAEETPDVHVSFPGEEGGCSPECSQCGQSEDEAEEGNCPAGNDDGEDAPHNFVAEPHAWLNSAGIHVDDDRVTVTLSVGDPRGAFAMSVERMEDGSLRLSVPTPSDSLPHMKLTPLASDGYYSIS